MADQQKQEKPSDRSVSDEQLARIREHMWGAMVDFPDPLTESPSIKFLGYCMPFNFISYLQKIRGMEIDPSDVYVCSFPKSGTTWMQHIVWYICTQDYDTEVEIDYRFPELELPPPYPPTPDNIDEILKQEPPRFFKSHIGAKFLPKKIWDAKVIYCYRNAKDCAVSYYHHFRAQIPVCFNGNFEKLANNFVNGDIVFGPWCRHVRDFYDMKKQGKPLLMVAFEDMKKDRMGVIKRVAEFLGKKLTEEQFQKVYEETSFEAMKKNSTGNYSHLQQMGLWDNNMAPFMRKGVVGDWKNHFTPELEKKFDEHVKEWFGDTDLVLNDQPTQ